MGGNLAPILSLSARALAGPPTRNGSGWSYAYGSQFLALFVVHDTLVMHSLEPENRPAFAAELRKHPYEVELLRADPYVASAVNGVLAENGGLATVPAVKALVRCAYCGASFKVSEPRCSHCGAVQSSLARARQNAAVIGILPRCNPVLCR